MDLEVESKQSVFYKQITEALDKGFLSHAYLIETNNNDIEIVKKYVLFLVKKIYEDSYRKKTLTLEYDKLIHLIMNDEFPDYVVVNPINNQIRKEQIQFIKEEFANKSLYGSKKVYVVYDCEKMNINAANTILKFLEEPTDDVVAIFVTNNQYNVLDTIRSRCQVISLRYEVDENVIFSDDLLSFFNDTEKRKDNDLMLKYNNYLTSLFKDKNQAISSIKDILKYYEIILNKNILDDFNLEETVSIVAIFQESLQKSRRRLRT